MDYYKFDRLIKKMGDIQNLLFYFVKEKKIILQTLKTRRKSL